MDRRKCIFFIVCAVVLMVAVVIGVIYHSLFFAALPSSVQNVLKNSVVATSRAFQEAFGISAAQEETVGVTDEVAVGDTADADAGVTSNDSALSPVSVSVAPAASSKKRAASSPLSSLSSSSLSSSLLAVDNAVSNADSGVFSNANINAMADSIAVAIVDPSSSCEFPSSASASSSWSQKVIFNEIAWMGVPSSSAANGGQTGNQEWMELKNNFSRAVDLSGWSVTNASGKIKVRFGADDRIAAGGFLLLLRGSTTLPYAPASDVSYSGDLRNAGDDLVLLDPACNVSDLVPALAGGWPAGDNTTKQTMERDADHGGWHTSVNAGGTPGVENSVVLPPAYYDVTVTFAGVGGATIASDPAGMTCTSVECKGTFLEKTKLSLTEKPATGAIFDGWTGACSGKGKCTLIVGGVSSVTAAFHIPVAAATTTTATGTGDAQASTSTGSGSGADSAPSTEGRVVIAAVQIAGAAASNDFIKLYNPSSVAVDLGGWKLRKRSQTGADYSLRTIPTGMAIAPGHYFVWANSADGFSASIGANVSSTETLAGNNSVALMDADGSIKDALAWGTGTGQYGEGSPYPDNPVAGQVLARKMKDGVPADTNNNANDFSLQ